MSLAIAYGGRNAIVLKITAGNSNFSLADSLKFLADTLDKILI